MTLDLLTRTKDSASASASPKSSRLPATLLPIGLVLAFVAVFALLFGARLLPALEVRVAPVIALRTAPGAPGEGTSATPAAASGDSSPSESASIPSDQPLLFQSSGWVEPDPYITNVPVLISGVVDEVHVLEGQSVKAGELLATLIDDDAKLDVEEAERTVASLDAKQVAHCAQLPVLNAEMSAVQQRLAAERSLLAEYQDNADRLASVPEGSVPTLEVEKARLKAEGQAAVIEEVNSKLAGVLAKINQVDLERLAVDAQIKTAQTVLSRKKLALQRTRIEAPIDGIVLHLHAAPGKKRMLDGDDPKSALIVELYDPENLQARIDVPLTEAAALQVGQPVRITTDLLPDQKFDGEVTRIVGEADLQRNTLQTKVKILDPDPRLRPEMLVRAEFYPLARSVEASSTSASASRSNGRLSLFAPLEGLFDRSDRKAKAWIVDDGRARLRDVQLGRQTREDHILVLDGLRPGDKVILPPHQKLEPGKRVEIAN